MIDVVEESREVYYVRDRPALVGAVELCFLKERAAENPRRRSRLCLHDAPDAPLHEMIIAHHRETFVRPHLHQTKQETLTVIEGRAALVTFGESGELRSVVELGPAGSGCAFMYRMPEATWHGMLVRSEWFLFAETTSGPFDRGASRFPSWAPDGDDPAAAAGYLVELEGAVRAFEATARERQTAVLRKTSDG